MSIDREVGLLNPTLEADGRVRLCVWQSNACDEDLDDVLHDWLTLDEEVYIANYFRLSTVLDDIECGYGDDNKIMDMAARPLAMAIRVELLQMVARIDAMKFEVEA